MKLAVSLADAERVTLEALADHHPFPDFRLRALGLLALARDRKPGDIAEVLRVSSQTVYNWSHAWRDQGLMGILNGHQGGRPREVTEAQIDTAVALAEAQPLGSKELAQRVAQAHPEGPPVKGDRLRFWLKRRGLVYRRTRTALKKSVRLKNSSRPASA